MKVETELKQRPRDILGAIVRQYVAQGLPVGSKAIANKLPEALSPATVRNVMAELEAGGYLAQPHTSRGEFPRTRRIAFTWTGS